ncbi:MAG: EAL domain-containing protein, partial [Lachnospiraceae bacterium]|nr:EAL domain-containing protein [Lachnospiraceae bacterium]
KRTGFPAGNLCLELTEGCRLLDIDYIKSVLEPLQKEGISLIIDDYGEGFDSLKALKELKPICVKYDIGSMEEFKTCRADQDALRAISESVNAYGSRMCIKGVNDKELFDILSGLPVSSMQGKYYGKPVPIDKLISGGDLK